MESGTTLTDSQKRLSATLSNMKNPKGAKPQKITSFAMDQEDEKNLATVKDYLSTDNQSVAIRFSLKETARNIFKRLKP